MKTLLIVAYYFAPAAVVGTHRILRFTKYLPSWGWRCAVVTAREDCYDLTDLSLLGEVGENCVVYRTRAPEFHKAERLYEPTEYGGMREAGIHSSGGDGALFGD